MGKMLAGQSSSAVVTAGEKLDGGAGGQPHLYAGLPALPPSSLFLIRLFVLNALPPAGTAFGSSPRCRSILRIKATA